MTKGSFNLDDYIDVAERIRIFESKYPTGSLQSRVIRWPFEGDIAQALQFIAVEARAYRTPDDERPGVGLAWEPFPGKTPYTKDSELMVAETSAWGRAIVAILAADTKRGVASKNEVRNRKPPAATATKSAPVDGETSLSEASAPEGADAGAFPVGSSTTWEEINARASGEAGGGGEGEGSSSASPELSAAKVAAENPKGDVPASQYLWAEAARKGYTRAKVLARLKSANQPVTDASSVTKRQLESIVNAGQPS